MSRLSGWAGIALGLARGKLLRDAVTGRILAPIIQDLARVEFRPHRVIHPEKDVPLDALRFLTRSAALLPRRSPVVDAIGTLLVEGKPYEERLPLRWIGGVSASKGELCMRLDSLPETMFLLPDEGFGPFDERGTERLKSAVRAEFSTRSREGLFDVALQRWDGAYIAGNHGASRRFALWRRLSDAREAIDAVVTPYDLDKSALIQLRTRWRLVCVRHDSALLGLLLDAIEVLPDAIDLLSCTRFDVGPLWFSVPFPHSGPRGCADALGQLHLSLDNAGVFDLGRYLTEAMAAARQREARHVD